MLVDFYHLASSPLERVLPQICEKVLASGDRLLIVAEPSLLDRLDGHLWTCAADAFLPHGRSDAPHAAQQPILLSPEPEPLNGASHIVLADGQWREEALGFARTFYFFDSTRLEEARASWRVLKGKAEAELRYWKQNGEGKWVLGP